MKKKLEKQRGGLTRMFSTWCVDQRRRKKKAILNKNICSQLQRDTARPTEKTADNDPGAATQTITKICTNLNS